MADALENPCTPEQIVNLIRAAHNDRYSITLGEAMELIENYAAVVAAEASIKASSALRPLPSADRRSIAP